MLEKAKGSWSQSTRNFCLTRSGIGGKTDKIDFSSGKVVDFTVVK